LPDKEAKGLLADSTYFDWLQNEAEDQIKVLQICTVQSSSMLILAGAGAIPGDSVRIHSSTKFTEGQ
jgi:hypothetical protein